MKTTCSDPKNAAAKKQMVQFAQQYFDSLAAKEDLPTVPVKEGRLPYPDAGAMYDISHRNVTLDCTKGLWFWLNHKQEFKKYLKYIVAHEFFHYKVHTDGEGNAILAIMFGEDQEADSYAQKTTGIKDEEFHKTINKWEEEKIAKTPATKIYLTTQETIALHRLYEAYVYAMNKCRNTIGLPMLCNAALLDRLGPIRYQMIKEILARHGVNIDDVDLDIDKDEKGEHFLIRPL